jgi:hypothetical protein
MSFNLDLMALKERLDDAHIDVAALGTHTTEGGALEVYTYDDKGQAAALPDAALPIVQAWLAEPTPAAAPTLQEAVDAINQANTIAGLRAGVLDYIAAVGGPEPSVGAEPPA